MDHVRIPWKGWIVVCDGAKALIFRNEGDAELLNLKLVEVIAEPHALSRDLGTDRPGRVYQSHGSARSTVEAPDFHSEAEAAFLAGIVDHLDKAVREHSVRHLVLVAPPKALGLLRQRLTPALRAIVTAEVDKDLAGLPTHEIEAHLAGSS